MSARLSALLLASVLLSAALLCLAPRGVPASMMDEPPDRLLALTFDDGPDPAVTDRILDALEQNGARATFFVIGRKLEGRERQLARIVEGGHQLGSHTWDHVDLSAMSEAEIASQLARVSDALYALTGKVPALVRPPYGFWSDALRRACPLPLIHWSVDTEDWRSQDAEAVAAHILTHACDGDIVLLHDVYPSTAEAVERVLPALRERGFRLVTVSQLFAARGIAPEPGHVYFSAPLQQSGE